MTPNTFRFKLDAAGNFTSKEFFHYFHNNITYKRAYLPDQYWDGKGSLDFLNKNIQIEVSIFYKTRSERVFLTYYVQKTVIILLEIFNA